MKTVAAVVVLVCFVIGFGMYVVPWLSYEISGTEPAITKVKRQVHDEQIKAERVATASLTVVPYPPTTIVKEVYSDSQFRIVYVKDLETETEARCYIVAAGFGSNTSPSISCLIITFEREIENAKNLRKNNHRQKVH